MNKSYKVLLFIVILLLPNFIFANSAEPPYIAIITENKDNIINISLEGKNGEIPLNKEENIMETSFTLYTREAEGIDKLKFKVEGKDESFFIELDEDTYAYNNIYTLNIKEKTLTNGKTFKRSATLVFIRLSLTLLIEGIVLFFFGFKEKKSFRIFLIVNLISQGGLNIFINSFRTLDSYMGYLAFIFIEVIILIVEPIIYMVKMDEHKKSRRLAYGIVANVLSLYIGSILIRLLPI